MSDAKEQVEAAEERQRVRSWIMGVNTRIDYLAQEVARQRADFTALLDEIGLEFVDVPAKRAVMPKK